MLEKRLRDLGQDHIADLLENNAPHLDPERIRQDLDAIDLDLVRQLMAGSHLYTPPRGDIHPAEVLPASFATTKEALPFIEKGGNLLESGRIAALVVAGGQGSRLGIEAPKGVVEVTPVKHKSLFQLHAEKILALNRRFGVSIPLFVMTSRVNDADTKSFFGKHSFFGLESESVHFFTQGLLPSLTPEGAFIISPEGGLFLNPDGHGGTLMALKRNRCLETMDHLGIEEIFYFQVDNPLVQVCDPLFIGLHASQGAQMSSKVVRKISFEEKVGVITLIDGKTSLVEYSDMADDLRYATDDRGEMLYWAGSIAIHMINRSFVEKITTEDLSLPYHRARKKIQTLDEAGRTNEIEGIKFETFIF
ncbi:MAG: UTP--glucose-1-phosphate uridylyltransferase, partial [Desulfomonilia bacterium]|nr:UTP--glucose-1-phosphate uridylyltransferase [Desulfomonilia bacterium]